MQFNNDGKSKLLSDCGMKSCYEGEFEKGLEYFDEGLKEDEDNILLLYNKAGCLVSLGEMNEARAIFEKIIILCERYDKTELVLNIKANSYTFLGDFEGSREIYEEILRYFPKNVDALLSRAIYFKRHGEFDRAFACFDEVLELDCDNFEANLYMGELCLDVGEKKNAKKYIDKIYGSYPSFPYALYLKGYYHAIVDEDYIKALSYFERAINLQPNFEKCYFEMGKCYILLGNAAEAKNCFKKVPSLEFDEDYGKRVEKITQMLSNSNHH